jgi:nitrate reductase beta subunit
MIETAASKKDDAELYPAHLEMLLDPKDPEVVKQAVSQGIPRTYIEAAQRSPVYKLAVEWRLAFPPHPEFRTLPMIWYVPPLSPLVSGLFGSSSSNEDIDKMRIPLRYLANLLTAGDEGPIRLALQRLMALRRYMRSVRVEKNADESVLQEVGMTVEMAENMYRLLAIAKYNDRYVIPTGRREEAEDLHETRGKTGYS